jgi:heme exporter protein CcmD
MADFLRMGGYAAYVWPSVTLTVVVMLLNVWWAGRAARRALASARRRVQMQRERA